MSLKLHHQSFASSRCFARKTVRVRVSLLQMEYIDISHILPDFRKHCIKIRKSRKIKHLLPFASAEDGVTVNQSSKACTSTEIEEMRMKLDLSLQSEDNSSGLLQSIHDAARLFELGIKQQGSLSSMSWFSTAWLGVDNTAWVKVLSYQASVYSLLQAANDVSSRGDGRDKDINVFIQQSVLKQTAPLESVIRDKLLAKQPEAYEWFWSEQIPTVVATFVNYFESDQRFVAATAVTGIGVSSSPDNTSDVTLLMLVVSCIAAIIKLGPAKVSCVQFFSIIPDTLGRLMDMLIEYIPIEKAYNSLKNTGLRREFLVHFGPRAAVCNLRNDQEGNDAAAFWVGLIQNQLRQAIDRERIWSRLTTSESIEVLERDLAIFGFFIALGKTTQSFLSANGYDLLDEPIEGLIRYLIGGSILYYPQLSSISSYQLYVEVVCEELDWLPFYPGFSSNTKCNLEHRSKELPNSEAVLLVLDVCCYWTQSFIRYSRWLENPANVKAARYVSTMHVKIKKCITELGIENAEECAQEPFWSLFTD
nr:uncharacterized protein LOC109149932 isoform X2 [Ipomoea batatas]